MIAKISATENLGGALGYNFKKVEKGEASILLAAELYADMEALIPKNCRTKKTVFHCSLNPHPDEKLSDERLTQIAKEYMEALGYGNQPYIVFKHSDISREHIHIVSLRVDSRGQKINDKFEKRRSKQITDALERKFGLIPGSKITHREMGEVSKIDTTKGNIKKQVAETLRSVLKHYKFCSLGELNAILSVYNLAYGITFIDDKEGIALNGSRLGKGYAANVFNGYFSNPTHNPFLDETLYGSLSARLEQSATVQPSQQNTEESDNLIDELFEDMADGLFLPTGNDDWKETAWQRKLRRQSKVNLKRRKR